MTATTADPLATLFARGADRLRADDPAGAVAALTEAVRLAPDRADAYHHRAGAHIARWHLAAALADADAAVGLGPGRADYLLTRANVRYHLRHVAAAWADYRAAFALDPDGNARAVVDALADQAGRWPEAAVRDCGNHLRFDPGDFLSLARRGLLHLLGGRAAEAAADLAAHAALCPAGAAQVRRYADEAGRRVAPPAPNA